MTDRRTKFNNYVDEEAKRKNKTKSSVRAKVEHLFRILKRVFGFIKASYRGLTACGGTVHSRCGQRLNASAQNP
jgi:hypothetical protein